MESRSLLETRITKMYIQAAMRTEHCKTRPLQWLDTQYQLEDRKWWFLLFHIIQTVIATALARKSAPLFFEGLKIESQEISSSVLSSRGKIPAEETTQNQVRVYCQGNEKTMVQGFLLPPITSDAPRIIQNMSIVMKSTGRQPSVDEFPKKHFISQSDP